MPSINRSYKREPKIKYKSEKKEQQADFYNSMAWKRLRSTFMSLHPLCACCLEHGVVEPATEAHHIVPFMRGSNEEERWSLFLSENNLLPVCGKCHMGLHTKDREYHMGRLDSLTETEYNYIHGKNY